PEDVDNFHLLSYNTFNEESSRSDFSSGYFESVDPVFFDQTSSFEEVMNYMAYNMFFSDRLLDRETGAIEFGFTPCFFELSGWKSHLAGMDCGWNITLYSISESYYNWLAYCWQTDGIVFGDMGEVGLSEPIWGYSNVSTGAGVVAARSSVTVKVNIKDFLQKTLDTTPPES
ncbi:MAG: DUF4249 domain-containing protein, partial [Muribaculaceae bacterium]|nr:DUF4249 domain-containing protein [Muribaculaceae bacterium]